MFFENFVKICNQHNTTPNAVCLALKLSPAAATKWRSGAVPRETTLLKIADYFGITVGQLMGEPIKEKAPPPIADDKAERSPQFKTNFIKLCSLKGESPFWVCSQIGIPAAEFSQWTDETIPRKATQKRIADYFGVTVAELMGEEKVPTGVTDEGEDELLKRTILYLEENGYIQKPEYEKLKELSEEERAVIAALRRVSDEKRSMAITMILSALNSQ